MAMQPEAEWGPILAEDRVNTIYDRSTSRNNGQNGNAAAVHVNRAFNTQM